MSNIYYSIPQLARSLSCYDNLSDFWFTTSSLFDWMRENGWIDSHDNTPTEKGYAIGYFAIRDTKCVLEDGSCQVENETLLTEKGWEYFHQLFVNGGHNE